METKGKEKEEGSLSILVVPDESREISPMKAGEEGRGYAWDQDCNVETSNEPE